MKIDSNLKKLIENSTLVLATINQNNSPHLIYVKFVKLINSNKVVITDNFMKQTILNLKNNSSCNLSFFVEEAGFELVGKGSYFNKGKYLEFVKNLEENKDLPAKGAIVFTVSKINKMN